MEDYTITKVFRSCWNILKQKQGGGGNHFYCKAYFRNSRSEMPCTKVLWEI